MMETLFLAFSHSIPHTYLTDTIISGTKETAESALHSCYILNHSGISNDFFIDAT